MSVINNEIKTSGSNTNYVTGTGTANDLCQHLLCLKFTSPHQTGIRLSLALLSSTTTDPYNCLFISLPKPCRDIE